MKKKHPAISAELYQRIALVLKPLLDRRRDVTSAMELIAIYREVAAEFGVSYDDLLDAHVHYYPLTIEELLEKSKQVQRLITEWEQRKQRKYEKPKTN